ncbi:hypothetical protein DL771_011443 [Monosporascus sp. 5C6A]|nr:hypothetical protein DL771_011443 [Monosporascus sp. 5C6A]
MAVPSPPILPPPVLMPFNVTHPAPRAVYLPQPVLHRPYPLVLLFPLLFKPVPLALPLALPLAFYFFFPRFLSQLLPQPRPQFRAAAVAALAADLLAIPPPPVHKRAQPHPAAVDAGHEPFHRLPVLLFHVAPLPVVPRRPAVRYDRRLDHLAVSPPAAPRLLYEVDEPVRLLHMHYRHDSLDIDPRP